ncbi:polar amino acid transport system substrate-binding protein [Metabacillus crassostreae]|uniref:basic amino acid ABC transporter substrate-binding protein n=1 Tax=Metabacillus crassostreae TaxID=929098 RepID=UPI00195B734B|nr:basic amino acid ABC transporter substrate-binding protein [Metabacillus crassostreae]MBM7604940.1 polar amino acid transport system substrate-binding protein [Metabacillus crassostreae]
MKKLLMMLMVLTFTFALAACGSSQSSSSGEGDGAAETEKKEKLRVVTDAAYAPFEYMDKGEIVGFDIDFVEAVAKEAGYEVEIVNVGWDPIFVEIKDEIADFAVSAITINDDRKQTYDFTSPYFLSTNKILVPEGSDIKSAEDLKDKVVAVQAGTTGQEAVDELLGKNSSNIKKFENNNLAIMELTSGGADAVVADNTVVEEYVKNNPDQKLVVIEDADSFAAEYYGLMFPKGSELKADFDKAINTVLDNGKYAEIYNEWFGSEPDVENLKAQQ